MKLAFSPEISEKAQENHLPFIINSKTCGKRLLSKRQKIGFQDQLSLNAGQKYCRVLQEEHSAILSTFIKLLLFIEIFVLSIFDYQEVLSSYR